MTFIASIFGWFISSPAGQALGAWLVKTFEDEVSALIKAHQVKQAAQGVATAFDQLNAAKTSEDLGNAAAAIAGSIAGGVKHDV